MAAIYLSDEERAKLRELLDYNAELLHKVCSHIAIENHARCSAAVLEARNQAAAGYAGIGKAFETAVDILTAELDEQQNLVNTEFGEMVQAEEEGESAS